LIIVEGPDGSGKSTLVKSLAADLKLHIQEKAVDDHGVPMRNLMDWTDLQLARGFRPVIYDRFNLISDPIYRPFLGKWNPEMYDPVWMSTRMLQFYRLRPILIYCLPERAMVMYNVAHGEDDNSAVAPFADQLWYAYSARMAVDLATATPQAHAVFHHDYERSQYSNLTSSLRFLLKRRLDADR